VPSLQGYATQVSTSAAATKECSSRQQQQQINAAAKCADANDATSYGLAFDVCYCLGMSEDLGTLPLPSVTPCDDNAWCVCQEG
jgi:hypothetical protein